MGCFYPELDHFESRQAGHDALRRAKWATIWRSWPVLLYYCFILAIAAVGPFVLPFLGVPLLWRSRTRLGLLVFVIVSVSHVAVLSRHRIRRNLRQQLAVRGQPICVPCGYDLTGNESGVCPECGTATSPKILPLISGGLRDTFRQKQIDVIKAEVVAEYANRIRSASDRKARKTLRAERDAEIATRIGSLVNEREQDDAGCI